MRRSELAHERQKTNSAERLASKIRLRRTDKNFADFAKIRIFQQYPPLERFAANAAFEKRSLGTLSANGRFVRVAAVHSRKMLHLPANVRFGEAAQRHRELA
jgi:hypothetical protein